MTVPAKKDRDPPGGIPFDVVSLDEIRPHRVERFTRHAMDPKDLPPTME